MSEWIKWEGGDCPVAKGTLIDIQQRSGKTKSCIPALGVNSASKSYWRVDGMGVDIVAYRLHVKEDQENDWVEWNSGECPVALDTMVNVRLRGGSEHSYQPALRDGVSYYVAARFWRHDNHSSDIIAYQLCKKEVASDGWIQWEGGRCPVSRGTLIDVRYRVGGERMSQPALEEKNGTGVAYWRHDGASYDIVAYRLTEVAKESEPVKQTETLRVLTEEGLELREEFESLYGKNGNCSCHMGRAPCSSCMHPGHPIAIGENNKYWTTVEKPSEPVDVLWASW